jgi:hypothetical protein
MRVGIGEMRMGWECRKCGHLATWTIRASAVASRAGERQLRSVMPLHTITTQFGEQGLRERVALETTRLVDPAARQQVKRALRLAAGLRASDYRQREPYVNHLLRVALRIRVHYGVRDADVISAALLHDTPSRTMPGNCLRPDDGALLPSWRKPTGRWLRNSWPR